MYQLVAAVILGQGALLADGRLIAYGAFFWLACHGFVVAYEEPTLARTFGGEYERYRANVALDPAAEAVAGTVGSGRAEPHRPIVKLGYGRVTVQRLGGIRHLAGAHEWRHLWI